MQHLEAQRHSLQVDVFCPLRFQAAALGRVHVYHQMTEIKQFAKWQPDGTFGHTAKTSIQGTK